MLSTTEAHSNHGLNPRRLLTLDSGTLTLGGRQPWLSMTPAITGSSTWHSSLSAWLHFQTLLKVAQEELIFCKFQSVCYRLIIIIKCFN